MDQADVINFLNEVAEQYPSAVSLAAGRPTDHLGVRLNNTFLLEALSSFQTTRSEGYKSSLLQYGRTAGIINDIVANQLHMDEDLHPDPDDIVITSGCQEALSLVIPALCRAKEDVLLVCNPTYIGATGAARANKIPVIALPNSNAGIAERLEMAIAMARAKSLAPRAFYLIPNFDNPTGRFLTEDERCRILAVCAREHVVAIEDNAYGQFRYEGAFVRPMATLDAIGSVVYLASYSKTLAPALRVGAAVFPKKLFQNRSASERLRTDVIQRKSFLTTNSSNLTQAMVGGLLLKEKGSLQRWVRPLCGWYRDNRDAMLDELARVFPETTHPARWNRPSGGFFLALELPVDFDALAAQECAANYGVVVMPMRFFALDTSQNSNVRLSFSSADQVRVREGVRSLARFVADRAKVLPTRHVARRSR